MNDQSYLLCQIQLNMPSALQKKHIGGLVVRPFMAAGVQFPPVHYDGNTFLPGQANNFYVYPAVGLAIYATRAKFVTNEMFIEAAKATADQVTDNQLKMGMLFPPQTNILDTEVRTAQRVSELVFESNLAQVDAPPSHDINAWLRTMLYKPEYRSFCCKLMKSCGSKNIYKSRKVNRHDNFR